MFGSVCNVSGQDVTTPMSMRNALSEIDALAVIKEQSRFIRIENELG